MVLCKHMSQDPPFTSQLVQAPGEAEAELAYLNIVDVIDAVLTDDVDALLFGARTVIRKYGLYSYLQRRI